MARCRTDLDKNCTDLKKINLGLKTISGLKAESAGDR